ncbi:hypothetical protein MUP37_05700 [Candidatus Bathyarchaeota archaeon]|nr:hypothetical protein [Candidatus Bathyarchaeota archaeon]
MARIVHVRKLTIMVANSGTYWVPNAYTLLSAEPMKTISPETAGEDITLLPVL